MVHPDQMGWRGAHTHTHREICMDTAVRGGGGGVSGGTIRETAEGLM